MLNVLRDNFKEQPWLKIVLLAVGIGLIAYLGNFFLDQGTGGTGRWVARVNGTEIPVAKWQTTARNMDRYYRQVFGDNYDQLRESLQIATRAVTALVEQEMIIQDARQMGLDVSKTELAEVIQRDQRFQDANGQFVGTAEYKKRAGQLLRGGHAAYESEMREALLMAKWTDMVTQPVSVSDQELREVYRRRTEKTSVKYVMLGVTEQDIDTKVTDDQMQAWYSEHPASYERGEARRIHLLTVEREAQRQKVQVPDAEVQASYEANLDNYRHAEQREARHILFRVDEGATDADKKAAQAQAEVALGRAQAGEDFATLARDLSQDPVSAERGGDLGYFDRTRMVAPFADAVWNAAVGDPAFIAETDFGVHVIEVTGAREAGTTPLEDVRPQILRELELSLANQAVDQEAGRLRGEITDLDTLRRVAEREGYSLDTRTVTQDQRLGDIGAGQELLGAVFALDSGGVTPPQRVAKGMALIAVEEILPPSIAPLEEVKGAIKADILNDRTRVMAWDRATRAHESSKSLAAAAKSLGLEVLEATELAPGQSPPKTGGSTPEMQLELFGEQVAVGDRGAVKVPGGAMIYEITGREQFEPERFESEKNDLREELVLQRRDFYRQSVVDKIRVQQEIEINHMALQG